MELKYKMYTQETKDQAEFINKAREAGNPVTVHERRITTPVTDQGKSTIKAALSRYYTVNIIDKLQGDTRLIFTEYLVERDSKFPYASSILKAIKKVDGIEIVPVNRLSCWS